MNEITNALILLLSSFSHIGIVMIINLSLPQ